ncbi:hypothetical protein OAU55_00275 [Candidatus Pelagibacter sp.]|nr:hypothetical protein [Candidatus Pelagibacter sp.]
MPIASGETYAAFLEEQNRRRRQAPLTPVADPVGYVAPEVNQTEQPFSNFGYDVAGDYLSSAGQSFKKAFTGQGVATMLPEMAFYPGGPTGLEKVYGGVADAGLGLFSTIVAGLGGVAGFVAEQVPFQSEEKEDRLSRDLLGGIEFGEQFLAPYLGVPLRLSKIARLGQQGKNLPSMDLRLQDGPEFDASLEEFAAAERQRNFAQQPLLLEDLTDDIDSDFVSIEDLEDLRIDPTQPMNIVNTTPEPSFSMEELEARMSGAFANNAAQGEAPMNIDAILNPTAAEQLEEGFIPVQQNPDDDITDIVDYEMVPEDDFDIDVDLDDDDMQERIQDVIQSLQDRGIAVTNDNILDDAAEAADQVSRAAENVRIQEAIALAPVTSIDDAVNTEQLRELYAKYNLPIPTTEAEQRAANIIIESNNKKNAESKIGTLPPSQRVGYTPPEDFRYGADLDYLKAHAPADVYNKQGPTMLEAKLIEQQEGRLGALPPINSGNDGPRIAPEFYSAAVQAAKNLESMGNIKSASYSELKRLMLKMKGVKIKELEWSGADEAFQGRKDVTPQELLEYLEDNTNLIEAKTAQGGPDNSGNIRVLEDRYVERVSEERLQKQKELFINDWEDDLPDIDKISDLKNLPLVLDELAEQVDGVNNGQELAEKYPDGYILQKEGNSLVPNGVTLVFDNAKKAAEYQWNEQVDGYREMFDEDAANELDNAAMQGQDVYNSLIFPDGNIPTWAVGKGGDLEYASFFPQGGTNMRETTYQFRDPTGKLEDDYFQEMHFSGSDRESNLVAHARTAEFPVQGGGTAYHVGEAQSDMQQGIRRDGTTPRTRLQEVAAVEVTDLQDNIRMATTTSELSLNKAIFANDVGLGSTDLRAQYPEDLETYKTIIANFKNKYLGTQFSSSDIDPQHTFQKETRVGKPDEKITSQEELQTKLYNFAEYIIDNENTVPKKYVTWAINHIDGVDVKINELKIKLDKNLEIYGDVDLSNYQSGAPFVESTDAWVDMVLRRQLADAIESGADYITLPNPEMVKQYTQGDLEGHRQFYGNIAPKNLLNIAKSADPTAELFPVRIQTDAGLEDTIALPLTPSLIQSLRQKGLPNYMLPFTVGGAASYGTLGSITKDETTGGAI